jgi:hypothetical protein
MADPDSGQTMESLRFTFVALRFFPFSCRAAGNGDGVSGGCVVSDVIPGVESCPPAEK